ncbi:MAG: branched-chain amino acid ABC transporter permease [Myxococcaceae bacterium]|nr:MAG: branched-chain amino acid ABC transporter permease [Myxococcaceae bacterium]
MRSILALAVLLAVAPLLIVPLGGYHALLSEMVIFAVFAIGFNLLLGYTGILSFGHAAYFGLAGYTMGLLLIHSDLPLWAAMLAGVLAAGVAAVIIGLLIIRKAGIYFAMLTIAFGQMFFFVAMRWKSVTGGEDGLSDIPRKTLFGLDLSSPVRFYYFTAVVCLAAAVVAWRVIHSSFGDVLRAIRENEARCAAIGYDVRRYKLASFVIAALFAAVSGTLYVLLLRYAFPQTMDWIRSGNVVVMSLVGGLGTFSGPIVGATLVTFLNNYISFHTRYWQLVMGVVFVVFVMFFPRGIAGYVLEARRRFRR